MPDQQLLLVLGVHRSGTSALTGLLDLLGWKSPKTQIPKLEENPKGFFESRPIARFNDALLQRFDMSWNTLKPTPNIKLTGPQARDDKAAARALLKDEFGDAPYWVLKDPRLCRLLPFWLSVMGKGKRKTKIVFILRRPKEVASSLKTRNNFSPSQGVLLWMVDVLQAEHASRGKERAFTSFDAIITNPKSELERLAAELDLPFTPLIGDKAKAIEGFLDPSLKHHNSSQELNLYPIFKEVYATLLDWHKNGEDAADYAKLDKIRNFVWAVLDKAHALDTNELNRINLIYSSLVLASFNPSRKIFTEDSASFIETASALTVSGLKAI